MVNIGNGPLAAAISAGETQVGALGEALLLSRQKRVDAQAQLDAAGKVLATAQDALLRAQQAADTAAADAVKAAAALPPGDLAQDIRGLSRLQRDHPRREGRRRHHRRGRGAVPGPRRRAGRLPEAHARPRSCSPPPRRSSPPARRRSAPPRRACSSCAGTTPPQLIEIERQQEAAEQQIGAGYVSNQSISGMAAHPRALAAVRYALAQLGDPYKWSEEGPDQFDCSGLMWAAYRSPGADYFDLPRVSRDQYAATRGRTVPQSALLPGDLLFFASGSSWTTIHHVGMYIGNGKMVQAPTTGDVVKISVGPLVPAVRRHPGDRRGAAHRS